MNTQPSQPGSIFEELANNPVYQAMRKRKDAELAEIAARRSEDEALLVQELCEAGVQVTTKVLPWEHYEGSPQSVWDLVNSSRPYPEAVPILLKHLDIKHDPVIHSGIARALACPWAMHVRNQIVDKFSNVWVTEDDKGKDGLKDGLAVAIEVLSSDRDFEEIVELLRDPRHGSSRVLLLSYLQKSKRPEAIAIIEELSHDPDLAIEIKSWRRKKQKN